MLVRFRSNPIAITADIENAFLMVGIKNEHKDMLWFLWFDDPYSVDPSIIVLRFNRLMFGLRPSPSILGAILHASPRLIQEKRTRNGGIAIKGLYVDDLLTGEKNVAKTFEIYYRAKEIMASGGFNLRKWSSNSKEVMQQIERAESKCVGKYVNHRQDDESYAKLSTGQPTTKSDDAVKLLGVRWNISADILFFDFTELQDYASSQPVTKGSVLKLVAKILAHLAYFPRLQ